VVKHNFIRIRAILRDKNELVLSHKSPRPKSQHTRNAEFVDFLQPNFFRIKIEKSIVLK